MLVFSAWSGGAVVSADSDGELYEPAELPRHLPTAGRQTESARWTERTAEVLGGPGAHCVSNPILNVMQAVIEETFSLWKCLSASFFPQEGLSNQSRIAHGHWKLP